MDAGSPIRRELDGTLADVLEKHREGPSFWPSMDVGFGAEFPLLGVVVLIFAGVAWLVWRLASDPTARTRYSAIEQTVTGVDLIDSQGQRESVPRHALILQVAGLWERRRILVLTTRSRRPEARRVVALGTVDWIPIRSDSTVREWEGFLGVKVEPQVTTRVA
ncbi:hypothetical protein Pan44_17370 [Caulifigura coniformis]|uniref:Uncharacterized protein n=1 Tax=Caulifigura coniformis TaxID=2527983 RepID=A0A517SC80_9PLAN|nr:hypothetical protein [Caulifigura coniformis]QDT53714.1 hypothetical protein Pan44_17370 [Caulifigura coniformis]